MGGRGASLLDGYMEDLATDRIYRLMIAQRVRHRAVIRIADENGRPRRKPSRRLHGRSSDGPHLPADDRAASAPSSCHPHRGREWAAAAQAFSTATWKI